jgi:hypothetical protein
MVTWGPPAYVDFLLCFEASGRSDIPKQNIATCELLQQQPVDLAVSRASEVKLVHVRTLPVPQAFPSARGADPTVVHETDGALEHAIADQEEVE